MKIIFTELLLSESTWLTCSHHVYVVLFWRYESLWWRTDCWDRAGQAVQLTRGNCMAKSCSDVQKKTILERDYRFFASLLSDMDLGNVDTREA